MCDTVTCTGGLQAIISTYVGPRADIAWCGGGWQLEWNWGVSCGDRTRAARLENMRPGA